MDGKALAQRVRAEVAREVAELGRPVGLATVLVGDDPASRGLRPPQAPGVRRGRDRVLPPRALCRDERGGAALARRRSQRRRPRDRDPRAAPAAGSDRRGHGHPGDRPGQGRRRLPSGERRPPPPRERRRFCPRRPRGSWSCSTHTRSSSRARGAVVVGRSNIVGKPVSLLLLQRHATVTICHSRTRDLAGRHAARPTCSSRRSARPRR